MWTIHLCDVKQGYLHFRVHKFPDIPQVLYILHIAIYIKHAQSSIILHSKITMAGDVVPYYTGTALVPTLK